MSLVIVGMGIKAISHITKETETVIRGCDKVYYLANNTLFFDYLNSISTNIESLNNLYFSREKRSESYKLLGEKIINDIPKYKNICVAIYGHPLFLVQLSRYLLDWCEKERHDVHVLPAISSLDCLFSDLGINPGDGGIQLMDATELLVYRRTLDPYCHIVLYQVGAIGQLGHNREQTIAKKALLFLQSYLLTKYDKKHKVCFYEAGQTPNTKANIVYKSIDLMHTESVSSISTLYIEPKEGKMKDNKMCEKLRSFFADFDAPSEKFTI